MKFISEYGGFRLAQYHGLKVEIPAYVTAIAADADGVLVGYKNVPKPDNFMFNGNAPGEIWVDDKAEDMYVIGIVDLEGLDWKESLVILS